MMRYMSKRLFVANVELHQKQHGFLLLRLRYVQHLSFGLIFNQSMSCQQVVLATILNP